VFRDSVDVAVNDNGAGGFATIGTLQAIDVIKCIVVQLMYYLIQIFGFPTPDFFQKSFIAFGSVLRFFLEFL